MSEGSRNGKGKRKRKRKRKFMIEDDDNITQEATITTTAAAKAKAKTKAKSSDSNNSPNLEGTNTISTQDGEAKTHPAADDAFPYTGYSVLGEQGKLYSVRLGKENRFFLVQLLSKGGRSEFTLWMRWGSENSKSEHSLQEYATAEDCIKAFHKKYKDLTGNRFDSDEFIAFEGKYILPGHDHKKKEKKQPGPKTIVIGSEEGIVTSTLKDPGIISFMREISDTGDVSRYLEVYQYDVSRLEPEKLIIERIHEAHRILSEIERCIEESSRLRLLELSNIFYRLIPLGTGGSERKPPLICHHSQLTELQTILISIGYISTLMKTRIEFKGEELSNKLIDWMYVNMNSTICRTVDKSSLVWKLMSEYLMNTQAPSHSFRIKSIDGILEVERNLEREQFHPFKRIGNIKYLLKGAPGWAVYGMLKDGLTHPPKSFGEAKIGSGFRFADVSSKAIDDAMDNSVDMSSDWRFYVLIYEVSLGISSDITMGSDDEVLIGKRCHSARVVGETFPNPEKSEYFEVDGDKSILAEIPCGKLVSKESSTDVEMDDGVFNSNNTVKFNEYLIPGNTQARLRYVAVLKLEKKDTTVVEEPL